MLAQQKPRRLILASSSPQRQRLLADAGYPFDQVQPEVNETQGLCSGCGPAELVSSLALRKAADVVRRLETTTNDTAEIVIGCDTVAECGGEILGKPHDREHARKMLGRLSGQPHRVYSGLCVWPLATAVPKTEVAVTHLQMDSLSEDALDDYLETDLWQGKAGAFGYQDGPDWLHITEGSKSNVIGLPLELLEKMLARISPA
ncbi:MAG: septum formation protein Maf [Halieaceae bacterium]|nr:septum formation protein Maf [Halieaceae bacterium]